jgi:predicted acylesterase/phospholipase RssA
MPEDQSTETEAVSNAKMSINDLKYIVMEGGGARGNTYLGAVRALEDQLFSRVWKYHTEGKPIETVAITSNRARGVMDYLKLDADNKNYIPIIEGVAGASAGAITTFALVLGLNSEEIERVLDFDFTKFLSEDDAGKYRMINEGSELAIGEDDNISKKQNDQFNKKGGNALGLKEETFKYSLDKDKMEIKGNAVKFAKREFTVSLIVKACIDGAVHNVAQVLKIISSNSKKNWYDKLLTKLFSNFGKDGVFSNTTTSIVNKTLYSLIIKKGLFAFFNVKSGEIKVTGNTVAAVFKDRGMFSGFQVREFFYDLMIYAATRDTYFQKRLIEFYNNEYNSLKTIPDSLNVKPPNNLTTKDFEVTLKSNNLIADFEIGHRGDYKFTDNAIKLFNHLQDLTFREFWNILKVEYAAAVSNFSTNSPLFFSDKYTPNYRVFEAVGASMSIPPAIRPVYNASDVLFAPHLDDTKRSTDIHMVPKQVSDIEEIEVVVNDVSQPFVKIQTKEFGKITKTRTKFKKVDYDLYEYAVKKALQQHLMTKKNPVYIDTNNLLELNTFLEEMRQILIGSEVKGIFELAQWKDQPVMVNNDKIIVNKKLLKFFYNSQFKGLLLDGGYFNNIPFNYFRDKGLENKIDGVLPIKLDGDYPPHFLNELDMKIPKLKQKESELLDLIDKESFVPEIDNTPEIVDPRSPEMELELIEKEIGLMFNNYVNAKLEDKKVIKFKKKAIHRLIKAWHKHYGEYNNVKPWEIPRGIVQIAFTGYSYGAKRGQIRDITDHSNIIPLYDYGVDTYDFDLKKVDVLAKLAQKEAYSAIDDYFNK